MSGFPFKGKVQTVTGIVNPSSLGKTLVHEHLSMTFDVAYVKAPEKDAEKITSPFSMENLGWIRYHPYSHKDNIQLNGSECEEAVRQEVLNYRALGGGCIVEVTTHGIRRNAPFLESISRCTGVQIVAGTGYYIAASHSPDLLGEPVEKLSELMRSEIVNGCVEAPEIRCGVIGEIGCSWPLNSFEKRVLQAAAQVQSEIHCPVSIHPGRNPQSPAEVLRIFQEAGGNADQVALCHLERTLMTDEDFFEFSQMGSYLELDLFGTECSYYQLNEAFCMPSDGQRIERIRQLVHEGYQDKIVISHDIHTKHRLTKYGGHGYGHILENIVPRMAANGLAEDVIHQILVTNPSKWLTFA